MNSRKSASVAAKVLVLIGVLPLLAALFCGLSAAGFGGFANSWFPLSLLAGVGVGFVAGGIALDRWPVAGRMNARRGLTWFSRTRQPAPAIRPPRPVLSTPGVGRWGPAE
jgi:hypothetical protein